MLKNSKSSLNTVWKNSFQRTQLKRSTLPQFNTSTTTQANHLFFNTTGRRYATGETLITVDSKQREQTVKQVFDQLGLNYKGKNEGVLNHNGLVHGSSGETIESYNPSTKDHLGSVSLPTLSQYNESMEQIEKEARPVWESLPAPQRGEIIRQIGEELRTHREALGKLVTIEVGKIVQEGIGEVQEFIDICDFAVGLSRTYQGTVIPSERKDHAMLECWNPIGNVGIITAFNFPVAVFGWNAAIAMTVGDCVIWKGSPTTPLTTVAVGKMVQNVLDRNNLPRSICTVMNGGKNIGEAISSDERIPLVSFTGSTPVGKQVRNVVNDRFGKALLELGGNNAVIVMDDADIELAVRGVLFAAVGTCGQRCTSNRRIILHEKIYDTFMSKLQDAYKKVVPSRIGDPLSDKTLIGPLHTENSVKQFQNSIKEAKEQNGKVIFGGNVIKDQYVEPCIVEVGAYSDIARKETFAPILYVHKASSLDEAIKINNWAHHGLSSSLFTNNISNMFTWLGPKGSDCGIVNVNIGTSGAEIGGAFGGEKHTGGGRESGSTSWKQYCRRSTATVNYGKELPLAQGIQFE